LDNIHPLTNGFGLLSESDDFNSFISLIFLNLPQRSLQKLQTIEYPCNSIRIVVDKADPTAFLLKYHTRDQWSLKICKIVDNTIIIGDVFQVGLYLDYFYDKCVYSLKDYDENGQSLKVRIL
jgi:hypothetical protein